MQGEISYFNRMSAGLVAAMVVAVAGVCGSVAEAAPVVSLTVQTTPAGEIQRQSAPVEVSLDGTLTHLGGTMYLYQGSYTDPGNFSVVYSNFINTDPVVTNNIVITNLNPNPQAFDVQLNLDVPITTATLTGGSVDIDIQDQDGQDDGNGNYAWLNSVGSTPIYMSQINGSDYIGMLGNTSLSATSIFGTANVSDAFGDVPAIPSLPGPANVTSIGIQLNFTASTFDGVTINSNFVVEPIPEPASLMLLAGGALWMARRRAAA
jgi:hypothetical protein